MAGALSSHIVDSYYTATSTINPPGGRPFGQPSMSSNTPSNISVHGAMSFNPQMHGGNSQSQPSFSFDTQPSESYMNMSDATILKIASLQAKLNQKLGPEYISQRPGPGGGPKLTYAEGWKIINLANEVFGFNGWSSTVVSLTTDFVDFNEESRRYTVGVTAIMKVTLRDGVFHEDIGYGMLENSKSKGAALDKCKKEAVTDGLKRCLRNFGNLLGNCLYDKSYTQEVIKIKVPPPKFDKGQLHRRPEFEESKPNIASTSTMIPPPPPAKPTTNTNTTSTSTIKVESAQASSSKPQSSVPPHMRSEVRSSSSVMATPDMKGKGNAAPTLRHGLNTPITTPATHAQQMPRQPPHQPHIPQPQYRQPCPAPAAPLPDRKVTFSVPQPPPEPIPDLDEDDSFSFSDDDAFLAAVDLGEGDLGRPIDFEEGTGRPIDFEEGASGVSSVSAGSFTEPSNVSAGPISGQQGQGRQGQNQNHPQQNQPPGNGNKNNTIRTNVATSSSTITTSSSSYSAQQPAQNRAVHSNTSSSRGKPSIPTTSTRQIQNQNQNQNQVPNSSSTASNSSSNDLNKRPATPSAGGFHFPPGMNPLAAQNMNRPPGNMLPPGQHSSSSGVGMKRPADSMQSSSGTSTGRRPAQGMGLAQGMRREPFTRLDVPDGGDAKRVKR